MECLTRQPFILLICWGAQDLSGVGRGGRKDVGRIYCKALILVEWPVNGLINMRDLS